jgi:hypothetical protein
MQIVKQIGCQLLGAWQGVGLEQGLNVKCFTGAAIFDGNDQVMKKQVQVIMLLL